MCDFRVLSLVLKPLRGSFSLSLNIQGSTLLSFLLSHLSFLFLKSLVSHDRHSHVFAAQINDLDFVTKVSFFLAPALSLRADLALLFKSGGHAGSSMRHCRAAFALSAPR